MPTPLWVSSISWEAAPQLRAEASAILTKQEVSTGAAQPIHISDNQYRSISNETALAFVKHLLPQHWIGTGGREGGSLKRPLLRQAPQREKAIFRCLVTKWAFMKRQVWTPRSLEWHFARVVSSVRPSVNNTGDISNLVLCLISASCGFEGCLRGFTLPLERRSAVSIRRQVHCWNERSMCTVYCVFIWTTSRPKCKNDYCLVYCITPYVSWHSPLKCHSFVYEYQYSKSTGGLWLL